MNKRSLIKNIPVGRKGKGQDNREQVATIATVQNNRVKAEVQIQINSILRYLKYAVLLSIVVFFIDRLVLQPVFGISWLEATFKVFGLDLIFQMLAGQLSIERVIFFGLVLGISTILIFIIYPGSPYIRAFIVNVDKRVLDFQDFPITKVEGMNKYCGKMLITIVGESTSFITFTRSGEKAVIVEDIIYKPEIKTIELIATEMYSMNDLELIAAKHAIEKYSKTFAKTVKENIFWRHIFSLKLQASSKKAWEIGQAKINPLIDFDPLGIEFDEKGTVKPIEGFISENPQEGEVDAGIDE